MNGQWYAAQAIGTSGGDRRQWCVKRDNSGSLWGPLCHTGKTGSIVRYATELAAQKKADELNEQQPADLGARGGETK